MVPDGWYGAPGHRGGRLRPKNVSGDNFRVALPCCQFEQNTHCFKYKIIRNTLCIRRGEPPQQLHCAEEDPNPRRRSGCFAAFGFIAGAPWRIEAC